MADSERYPIEGRAVTAVTGEALVVRRAPDLEALRRDLGAVRAAGIASVAVVLKHSAIFPEHERIVGELAREMGFTQVSLSSSVSAMVKMVPRGYTATADAYLTPHILRCKKKKEGRERGGGVVCEGNNYLRTIDKERSGHRGTGATIIHALSTLTHLPPLPSSQGTSRRLRPASTRASPRRPSISCSRMAA